LLNWAEVESDEDQHAGAGAAAQIATQPPASDALLFGDGGAASQGGELLNWVDDPDEDGDGDEEPAAVPDAEAGGHRGVAAAGIDGGGEAHVDDPPRGDLGGDDAGGDDAADFVNWLQEDELEEGVEEPDDQGDGVAFLNWVELEEDGDAGPAHEPPSPAPFVNWVEDDDGGDPGLTGGAAGPAEMDVDCGAHAADGAFASDETLDGNAPEEGWQANDPQCGVCDDGGDLLLCEGVCMRSFHASPSCHHGVSCLGMTEAEYEAIEADTQPWVCPACCTGRHACASCHFVGSLWAPPMALTDPDAVFHCSSYGCWRFYHLKCSEAATAACRSQHDGDAAAPASVLFTCEAHMCASPECMDTADTATNPVVSCRRCPRGYHITCMPQELKDASFSRVWLNRQHALLAGQDPELAQVQGSLIYCQRHAITRGNGGPALEPPKSKRMTDQQRRYGFEPACQVFTEDTLHEAARLSAAASGEPKRCLGCNKLVHPPQQTREQLHGSADHARRVAETVLDEARRDPRCSLHHLRASLQTIGQTQITRHGDGQGGGGGMVRTINEARLRERESQVLLLQRGGVSDGDVVKFMREMQARHGQLRAALNPFMVGPRYTSYGRHFTQPHVLAVCAARMALFLRPGDRCVDTCCGENNWLKAVQDVCGSRNRSIGGVTFQAFDLFPAKNKQPGNAQVADWFTVNAAQLGLVPHGHVQPDQLVMGLNPPFGMGNSLAAKFINHMAAFRPRLIVLIVPQGTPLPSPEVFTPLVYDIALCAGHIFYLPGSHVPTAAGGADQRVESWNKVNPAFIILQRTDTLGQRPTAGRAVATPFIDNAAAVQADINPSRMIDPLGAFWRVVQ